MRAELEVYIAKVSFSVYVPMISPRLMKKHLESKRESQDSQYFENYDCLLWIKDSLIKDSTP